MADLSFAQSRFGLGARGDSPPEPEKDPRGWVLDQIGTLGALPGSLATRASVASALQDYRKERAVAKSGLAATPPAIMPAAVSRAPELMLAAREQRDIYVQLVGARVDAALTTNTPFMERMAHFWANHFAVSAQKQTTIGFAGLLEADAIRPNVAGRFGDMLLAVERHPAMLLYLDQATSIGPDSMAGSRAQRNGKTRGLNENLAREIMELHTLGVRSGYEQADVTEFARALTGWTVAGLGNGPGQRFLQGAPGDFTFAGILHEPGARTIMGKRYDQDGDAQARAILADLAVHPATARHIATKLARHFAADDPPPMMVRRIEKAFLANGGDLPTIYRALVASPEAWDSASPKFRTPWDWTIASLRAASVKEVKGQVAVGLLRQLGQPVWQPSSPAGFDDIAASWAGPDALVRRVEAAQRIAQSTGALDARALAPKLLGARLMPATATAIGRAESPQTAMALLLASPEFLRR